MAARKHTETPPPEPWPLQTPATPEMVDELERRLGVELPPSYRQFLLLSNGLQDRYEPLGDVDIPGLLPCDQVAWTRDFAPELLELLGLAEDATEEHYCGDPADPEGEYGTCDFCLPDTLVVGRGMDSIHIMLNPRQVDDQGEWECWEHDVANASFDRWPTLRHFIARRSEDFLPREGVHPPIPLDIVADESTTHDARLRALRTVDRDVNQVQVIRWAASWLADTTWFEHRDELLEMLVSNIRNCCYTTPTATAVLTRLADPGRAETDHERFVTAVGALSFCDDPAAVRAVRQVLTSPAGDDAEVRENLSVSEEFHPEIRALWERTGSPWWLCRLVWTPAGVVDREAVRQLADFVAHPRPWSPARGEDGCDIPAALRMAREELQSVRQYG